MKEVLFRKVHQEVGIKVTHIATHDLLGVEGGELDKELSEW